MPSTASSPNESVFDSLSSSLVAELREAFSLIDRDGDGFIKADELRDILRSTGMPSDDAIVREMLSEGSNSVNLTMFLSLFARHLPSPKEKEQVLSAYSALDQNSTGQIGVERLRRYACEVGGERVPAKDFDAYAQSSLTPDGRSFCYRGLLAEGN